MHAVGLLAMVLITLWVYAWEMFGEGYAPQRLALGQYSSLTPLLAVALTAFFVLVFGPIAFWVLARSGFQSFGAGIEAVSQLPTACLMLTIVVVAAAEELIYLVMRSRACST